MQYTNPDIDSSYRDNDLGRTLYDTVLKYKPRKIVELGVLGGYSTVAMAMALRELGEGHIYGYDLFEDYEFKKSSLADTQANIDRYGVSDFVTLIHKDCEEWLLHPEPFDLMHVDLSNKGDTIERVYAAVKDQIDQGSIVLFEGGSEERDRVEWMTKYNQRPIRTAEVRFEVIDTRFPSLSMITKQS